MTDEKKEEPKCGKRYVEHEDFITNGFPTKEGDWPWHSAIFHITGVRSEYKCGGTLINQRTVVTAAHYLYDSGRPINAERVIVQLGKHNRELSSPNTQEFRAHRCIIHAGYNRRDLLDDIALIRLSTEVQLTHYVQPACQWDVNRSGIHDVLDRYGIVIGWGLNEKKELSNILNQATMPVVSFTECLQSNRVFFGQFISDYTYCAGFRNGKSTARVIKENLIHFSHFFRHKRLQWRQRRWHVLQRK